MKENAVVIMAKSPLKGDVKTRLSPALDERERRELYTELLNGTVERLRNIRGTDTLIACSPAGSSDFFTSCYGLPCFEQVGADLGLRLSNAFMHIFNSGYKRAVVVGSDIPGLNASIAADALNSLRETDLAIGPSTDGGYYLIGLMKPRPELFQSIPWSTSEVLKATLSKAHEMNLSMELLEILDDVDTPEDLKRLGII